MGGREARVTRKVASLRLMKQVWPEIEEDTFKWFEGRGQWREPTEHIILKDFLPWLYKEVDSALSKKEIAEGMVDDVLAGALALQQQTEAAAVKAEEEKQAALAAEEAAKAKQGLIRIFLQAKSLGLDEDGTIGPIEVSEADTIADVESKIQAFLTENSIDVQ